jgi:hypothetical protein
MPAPLKSFSKGEIWMCRSLILFSAAAGSLLAQAPASISGTLTGDDGAALAGIVTVLKTVAPMASGRAEAGKDGKFTISNLTSGTYTVCAAVTGRVYMDPCAWSPVPVTVAVTAGQPVTGYRLIVTKGEPVQVRLNDPGSALGAVAQPNQPAPHVQLGFFTARGLFEPMVETSKDATGHNLQGFIPPNTPVPLYVGGKGVQIADSTGKTLNPSGTSITVSQPKGSSPLVVTLAVKP